MKLADIIASTGVLVLLVAFFMNLFGKIASSSRFYIISNIVGAGMCCTASYMIRFYPFVILEAIWAGVAVVSLFKHVPRGTSNE